jgi:hypothetical protein
MPMHQALPGIPLCSPPPPPYPFQDLRQVCINAWEPGDILPPPQPGGTTAPAPALKSRKVAYIKPLRIPIPLAPKQCNGG